MSQRTLLYRAVHALMKLAAPNTSVLCKRIWSKRERGTKLGDGFELLDMETVDGKLRKKENEGETPDKLLGEWVRTHGDLSIVKEIQVLIETRRSNAEWPRASLELANRIQVRRRSDVGVAQSWLFTRSGSKSKLILFHANVRLVILSMHKIQLANGMRRL